jgi:hypothetical protein
VSANGQALAYVYYEQEPGRIAARGSNVMANLNNAKSNIVSVIHSLP